MPVYAYRARDTRGRITQGTMNVLDAQVLRMRLEKLGYYLTFYKEAKKKIGLLKGLLGKRVKPQDLVLFARQFAAMISGGVPITRCLSILEQQVESRILKELVSEIHHDISTGARLADTFAKHSGVFSPLFINLVRAGEASGTLDEVLDRLAGYIESDYELKQRVKNAFVYPVIVLILAVAVIIFLLLFAIPTFSSVYTRMGVTLPLPTLLLLKASTFMRSSWYFLAGIIFAAVAFHKISKGGKFTKPLLDKLKLRIPVLGKLHHKSMVSHFVRAFAAMIKSGVPIIEAINITAKVSENSVLVNAIETTAKEIREGKSIAIPLRNTKVFPPMVVQMIAVGEESGNLDEMLAKIGDFLDRDVELMVRRMTTLLEPLLTVFLGLVIGGIAMAMYMPMFNIVNVIRG